MNKLLIGALAGCGTLFMSAAATAAPVVDGITTVEVTVDLGPVQAGLLGSAAPYDDGEDGEEDALVVSFPITGGDLDGLAGTIEHEGSGLSLSANGTTVELTDFVIDTVNSQLTGIVSIAGGASLGRVAIFDFDLSGLSAEQVTDVDNPAISLLVTEAAAGALADTLGIAALAQQLAGAQFGLAGTAPVIGDAQVVPLPGAAIFFVTGAAAFAARRRSKA